jgi:hypothetical protein
VAGHAQGAQRGQRPFWEEPVGSGLFGRIAALRIEVKTSSLDLDSRLALHPKQGKLALAPIDEMSSKEITGQKRNRMFRFEGYLQLFEDTPSEAPAIYDSEEPADYLHGSENRHK